MKNNKRSLTVLVRRREKLKERVAAVAHLIMERQEVMANELRLLEAVAQRIQGDVAELDTVIRRRVKRAGTNRKTEGTA